MLGLFLWFGLFYSFKLKSNQSGMLQPLIALIVYAYGPTAALMPPWFLVLIFVAVVFTLSARPLARRLTEKLEPQEIPTLAKFLLLSAVILPLLPNQPVSPYLPATPFKLWLAVVVISSISYAAYILKKYFLKKQGYLLTGLLGGLYSSTATTVVLARKSRFLAAPDPSLNAGLVAATGMMYLRLLALVALMNFSLIFQALPPMLLFAVLSIGFAIWLNARSSVSEQSVDDMGQSNPLELGVALLFALLFVAMMLLTQHVITHFGQSGLDLLSFLVGFTDIDPFVLSILNGQYDSTSQQLISAILVAAGSNNLLKGFYALFIGNKRNNRAAIVFLFFLGLATIAYGLALSRW